MKRLGLFDNYFLRIDKLYQEEFRAKLRRDNVERVYILCCIGILFFVLLLILDYLRYYNGVLQTNVIFRFLFYDHLALAALIIPVIIISRNREHIQRGQYKYSLAIIYASMIYIAFVLLTMAILSIIDRNAVVVFVLFVLLINFVVIFPHIERVIFNLLSLLIIVTAIYIIDVRLDRGMISMYINSLECVSVAGLAFALSTYLYNNEVKRFTYESILRENNLLLEKEKKVSNTMARKLEELNAQKSKLYTNITHEFRTPLTVILGMSDRLRSHISKWDKEKKEEALDIIERNGKNLLHLINEMLSLSKLETGLVKLNLVQRDIISFLRYINESFQSYALSKDIHLTFLTELESFTMDVDIEKMQQILSNLLSNAIKFTPEGGWIKVLVKVAEAQDSETLIINVKDSGIGIPVEKLSNIFDRFYQVDDATTRQKGGSGIGLSLTKELVKLMNGDIMVSSEQGKGTEFSIRLPVSRQAKKVTAEQALALPDSIYIPSFIQPTKLNSPGTFAPQTLLPLILIIEDNLDVAYYLQSCLNNNYRVEIAYDGKKGIDKAIKLVPDIIISDVMMPGKDGYEVCTTLKQDERTSHIPIILLTAKVSTSDKLTGLESGADAYLAKPFDRKELLLRIKNLVELKEQLQKKYEKGSAFWQNLSSKPTTQSLHPEDEFLNKVNKHIQDNLSDENFGNVQLCKKMAMSRSQIHRKIKALTSLSTSIYIRTLRLYKAKELLHTTDLNISEIAYDVGFKDPNYFTRAFTEEFNASPSAIRK